MRLSFQTKILIPVLGLLIATPAIMTVVVDRYITGEQQTDAQQQLSTAEGVFQQLLDNRSRDLLQRFRSAVDEASYRAIAPLPPGTPETSATIKYLLSHNLGQYGDDTAVMVITAGGGAPAVGVGRGGIDVGQFARAAASISAGAMNGDPEKGWVSLNGGAYDVVAVPIFVSDKEPPRAVLTVGVRLADATVQELKKLTQTEIVIISDGQVIVSTLPPVDPAWLRELFTPAEVETGNGAGALQAKPVVDPVGGEHFLARSGIQGQLGPDRGFRYVLLSNMEASDRALADTKRVLLEVSLAGILLSAAVVLYLIRRTIRPLSELRDTAEAVGRGDFSRRITGFPNDECGDLAEAFNRMTVSLQTSLAELEKTVETLKATQSQLIQSGKLSAVGQFVAGVAHELNNPLTAVIGFADLLSQTGADPKIRPHLDMIAKSAHRCHRIVHNLLSFARQHVPERKFTQVHGTIDEVLEIMAYDLRTDNIKVVRDFDPDVPPIMADPHELQQVFVNIVGNARQAIQGAKTEGEITVRTRVVDRNVRIEFADNGPGISPENLSRIFDPFFTTKPVGEGTGLGLSLVYGMIQEHGGKISARSEPGQGATFIIDLPITTDAPVALGERGAETDGRTLRRSIRRGTSVLVVDDEIWTLDLARELLKGDGHDVETAVSGERAIEAIGRRHFDVIVTDLKMPGMNGIQLFEHLFVNHPELARRVIFMTGDIINDSFKEFLRRHSKSCLSKPFPIGDFQKAVSSILENGASGRIPGTGSNPPM